MSSQAGQDPRERSPQTQDPKADSDGRTAPVRRAEPVCPACGERNSEQSQFCCQCGAALLRYCPRCGRQVALDVDLCDHCSSPETQSTVLAGRCQRCGFQSDQEAESCLQCGARLLVKCPQCSAPTAATFDYCPRCGFNYSRFVTNRLLHRLDENQEASARPGLRFNPSSILMIILVTLSLLVMVYIVWQIQ
ncbi:MAG TPA: zinc ribbon domain-containing protein [Anaerolineae bacterium]|nr:zinc ribbon domain-containing protein [Anaerolineae bacterium]